MAPVKSMDLRRAEDADTIYWIRQMNVLLEAEGNFVAFYDYALERLTDEDQVARVREFRRDHEQHVVELRGLVEAIGGVPFVPEGPSPAGMAEIDILREIDLDEDAILGYFEIGERQSLWLYDAARAIPGLPADASDALERAFRDEERHHAWALSHRPTAAQAADAAPPERPLR